VDWLDLRQDKDQWRALVNKVMNLRVQYNVEKSLNIRFSRRGQIHEDSFQLKIQIDSPLDIPYSGTSQFGQSQWQINNMNLARGLSHKLLFE
jgi:hypothetical protein